MPLTARDYLYSLEHIGIKLGLDHIRALLAALGHPDTAYASLVIGGTNGKGSVTAMVERGLRAGGVRTGRYTSPHLRHLEERIAIGGQPIAADVLDDVLDRVRHAARGLPAPPTFFEVTTAAALLAFRDAGIETAVIEVGLGGRLDATNAVLHSGAAITAIDLDHQAYLGDTIEAIAREKAGIIKPGVPVVVGANPASVRRVLDAVAAERGAPCIYAPAGVVCTAQFEEGRARLSLETPARGYGEIALGLRGRHQIDNAITAARFLEIAPGRAGGVVDAGAIVTGLEDVEWPARLELARWRNIDVLIDGAHNPAGARALAAYVSETYGRRLPMIVGVMEDKAIDDIVRVLAGAASHFVMTAASTPRAAPPEELCDAARRHAPDLPVIVAARPADALAAAVSLGSPVVVAGSLFLAGEIRSELS